ncbi:hypothetical protein EJ04DRAFT_527439 [Polyplosphaeria fusca]|uniref:F-box domain-containing protein n=1 Tax=Polyplosphaeria fusca TaxID=682080 RepID=A0A9P4QS46_9PLEO|nr:hypothetical protein EJ04DRAFT_527439 [Polyplosphaeria fusca]
MESPSALTARTSEQGLLPSLPYELLAAVCEYLDPPSLRALSLTCRKAVLPANDVLYQGYNNLSSGRKRLHLFLRTLVQQPELAAKIKSIELSGWVTETELEEGRSRVWNEQLEDITSPRESSRWSDVANIKSNAIPARDMFSRARTVNRVDRTNDDLELFALFLDAAQNLGFVSRDREYDPGIYRTRKRRWAIASNGGDLVRNLAKNIEDAHVFLILASVPNLESLSIREMRPFKTLNWSCFFRKSNTALNSLKKLHIFRSYMGGQWDGGKLASYRSLDQFLNYMPQLTDLNLVGIVGVDGWKISKRRRSTGGANTKLSKVTLVDSEFTEGFFAWLLSGTDSITEFTCLFESQTFWLNYQEVIDQLAGSKDTLQSLTLDEASPLSDYNPTSLANLSHFERLESLAAPHQYQ